MDALFIAIYEICRKILLDKISKLIIIRNLFYSILETWPRGRRHSPAKGAYELKLVSRVRIPPSPPDYKTIQTQLTIISTRFPKNFLRFLVEIFINIYKIKKSKNQKLWQTKKLNYKIYCNKF